MRRGDGTVSRRGIPLNERALPGRFGPRRAIGLLAGPALLVLVLLAPSPEGLTPPAWRVAAVGLLMATWWITEAIPISATALLPLALFPVLGAVPVRETAAPYANPVIFLFLGGFLIAGAMQRWGLHRRLALRILRLLGTRPRNMVGGFMLAAAFLSMWVSNTATTVMMLPIGLSVMQLARPPEGRSASHFETCLMLGIAYAASIGGIGTLVGTPPNALLAGFMAETFGVEIGFTEWLGVGLPVVVLMLPLAWLALTARIYPVPREEIPGTRELLRREIRRLGPPSVGETATAAVFGLTAAAWVLRPALTAVLPGLSDAGIAIAGGLLLFLIPVDFRRGEFVMDWSTAGKLPWDVLLLFGGGLSLAGAIQRTGLAEWMGASLAGVGGLPVLAVAGIVVALMIFLTELTSNTASTAAFLPILASLAVGIGENPLLLAIPAVLAASCAFMLPVATPPNAIVFASGRVRVPQMARAGIVLNVLFLVILPLATYLLVGVVFGARPGVLPDWAGGG